MREYIKFDPDRFLEIQNRHLNQGRSKDIGIVERFILSFRGRRDGLNKMPGLNEEGIWTTPVLKQEEARYDEYCDRMWGYDQIRCNDIFVEAETLLDDIRYKSGELEKVRRQKKDLTMELTGVPAYRKRGEEELSDSQVTARRQRENEERIAPYSGKIHTLEEAISQDFADLFRLLNFLIESGNAFRYICDRQKNHTLQRINVYWNMLLKSHPEKEKLPVCLRLDLKAEAEEVFNRQHENVMSVYAESQRQYENWKNSDHEED